MPSFFAVSARFLLAGLLLATWVVWRRGLTAFRATRAEIASAALIGLLLPGANALLFVAEHDVPTGLASLIIASVPLLVVCLRLAGGERPAPRGRLRRARRFRRCRAAPRPRRRGNVVGNRADGRVGRGVGRRVLPFGPPAAAARRARGDDVRDARRRTDPPPLRAGPVSRPVGVLDEVDPGVLLPGRVRLADRVHGLYLAARARAAGDRLDVRVREPRRRDRPRRARPRRDDHLADRRRCADRARVGGRRRPAGGQRRRSSPLQSEGRANPALTAGRPSGRPLPTPCATWARRRSA